MYDDECGFCTWFVEQALDRGEFEPVGFDELTPDQRARLPENYEDCMHLLTDDAVYSCGAAAEKTLELCAAPSGPLFDALRRVPGYDGLRERVYRTAADNRDVLGRYRRSSPPAEDRGSE